MCAWEEFFIKKLETARNAELICLKVLLYIKVSQVFLVWLTPILVILSVFSSFVYFGNVLTSEIALSITATFVFL